MTPSGSKPRRTQNWTLSDWQAFQTLLADLEAAGDGGRELYWGLVQAYQFNNWERVKFLTGKARRFLDGHKRRSPRSGGG